VYPDGLFDRDDLFRAAQHERGRQFGRSEFDVRRHEEHESLAGQQRHEHVVDATVRVNPVDEQGEVSHQFVGCHRESVGARCAFQAGVQIGWL